MGIKKAIQKDKGELFVNATDVANTLNLRRKLKGMASGILVHDYYETQVFRIGYSYKF